MANRQRKLLHSLGLLGVALGGAGCVSENPNAPGIDPPIVTSDAPKTSEEAAERSEPAPIQYRSRRSR